MKIALTALALVLVAAPAAAQSICAPRESILEQFALRHKERPISRALAANGAVLEVLANADRSTWTMIATGPTGVTCIAATGTHWEPLKPKYGVDG